jgi:hypothetical protein
MLEDGTYDALVIDANAQGEALILDLTIVAGDAKGEVVTVRATGLGVDEIELLGMPATLTVAGGEPSVVID